METIAECRHESSLPIREENIVTADGEENATLFYGKYFCKKCKCIFIKTKLWKQ